MRKRISARTALLVALAWTAILAATATPAAAYIGPGAGFAVLGGFAVILVTMLVALVAILAWPFRMAWRALTRKKKAKPRVRRVIIVGLDGQDPRLTDQFFAEGKLPNFRKLADQGTYSKLKTTFPSVSPVAWSSFSTGVSPAKHNIYDFLDRDKKTYLPLLSSTQIGSIERFWKLGKWRIPREKPELRLLRKSKPFWTELGDYGIWSTVLRVPITFPPDEFYGAQLSAMCVPDLLGTQGTFLLFTTRPSEGEFKEGGLRIALEKKGDRYVAPVEGPENAFLEGNPPMTLPLEIVPNGTGAKVVVGGEEHTLETGKLTGWVKLVFRAAPGVDVSGLVRMQLLETPAGSNGDGGGGHVSLYCTPISLDPGKPAMPVSHPSYYSTYLAKKIGDYSTLGLAEDTWALNEEVTDDATFLELTYDIDQEREDMFFAALDKLDKGTLVTVFDATDRIQHMFWRYIEEGHPAARGRENAPHRDAIEKLYEHNDRLVGRVMERLKPGDVLFVCSDHGFTSFRRGVNLNAWLKDNGYLHLKPGADGTGEWLQEVDWSKTRAFQLGLTGMFLNVAGRESEGIVDPKDVPALKAELIEKLSGLRDTEKDEVGINEVFDTHALYQGPYIGNAPDLLIGYNSGYRVSWDGASGVVSTPVFEDNTKAWSGDHCVDPRLVPGVLFSNVKIDDDDPALIDLAPTTLRLFGVPVPDHVEGKPILSEASIDRLKTERPGRIDPVAPETPA